MLHAYSLKHNNMSEEIKKFKITIDGQTTEVAPGTTILEAARQIGGKSVPPAMCYYSKLEKWWTLQNLSCRGI